MSNINDDDRSGNDQLPVPRREVRTSFRHDKSIALFRAFVETFKDENMGAISQAIAEVATQTDIELLQEQNRAREVGYKYEAKRQKVVFEAEQVRAAAGLEQSKLRLRFFGLWAAVLLSLVNSIGAVLLLIYGPALVSSFGLLFALCLGLAALSAACAGAAFAIATGVAVRPKDFSAMLTAAHDSMKGKDENASDAP